MDKLVKNRWIAWTDGSSHGWRFKKILKKKKKPNCPSASCAREGNATNHRLTAMLLEEDHHLTAFGSTPLGKRKNVDRESVREKNNAMPHIRLGFSIFFFVHMDHGQYIQAHSLKPNFDWLFKTWYIHDQKTKNLIYVYLKMISLITNGLATKNRNNWVISLKVNIF